MTATIISLLAVGGDEIVWWDDEAAARAEARKLNKPIFLVFR